MLTNGMLVYEKDGAVSPGCFLRVEELSGKVKI
jgi:hypothetical protein